MKCTLVVLLLIGVAATLVQGQRRKSLSEMLDWVETEVTDIKKMLKTSILDMTKLIVALTAQNKQRQEEATREREIVQEALVNMKASMDKLTVDFRSNQSGSNETNTQ